MRFAQVPELGNQRKLQSCAISCVRERERERLRKLQSGAEPATAASSVISLLHARGTISSNTCASYRAAQSGRGTGGIEHRNASFKAAHTPTAERARAPKTVGKLPVALPKTARCVRIFGPHK